jgi:hypothetical protein
LENFDYEDWSDNTLQIPNNKVFISHKAIINNDYRPIWANLEDFYSSKSKKLNNYDLILCGHYHRQYDIKGHNKKIILNPGSFTRREANFVEGHMPSYYMIDTYKNIYELQQLPGTKKFTEVISAKHLHLNNILKNIKSNINETILNYKLDKNEIQDFVMKIVKGLKNLDKDTRETLEKILYKLYGEKIKLGD